MKKSSIFTQFAQWTSCQTGRPFAFITAFLVVVVWLISGPFFGYSDTWQLVINTGTTIITFLMVFLIQNSQNRDTKALEIKLDELIRVTEGAHLALLDIENMDEEDLERLYEHYDRLAKEARKRLAKGESDTNMQNVSFDLSKE